MYTIDLLCSYTFNVFITKYKEIEINIITIIDLSARSGFLPLFHYDYYTLFSVTQLPVHKTNFIVHFTNIYFFLFPTPPIFEFPLKMHTHIIRMRVHTEPSSQRVLF